VTRGAFPSATTGRPPAEKTVDPREGMRLRPARHDRRRARAIILRGSYYTLIERP
jgi:hypothetical protein